MDIFAADKVGMDTETDRYRDYRFAKWASRNLKVQGIPPSAFYSVPHKHLGENYIRFCFIKVGSLYYYIILSRH